ncbi:MAG: hypothetical protein ACXW11_07540 [Methylotenera sp.]
MSNQDLWYYAGALEGKNRALQDAKDNAKHIAMRNGEFTCDSAGVRAVLRDTLKYIRDSDPNHNFLNKDVRDKLYMAERDSIYDAAIQNPIEAGWALMIADSKAIRLINDEAKKYLAEVNPTHHFLNQNSRTKVFDDAWLSEVDKINKWTGRDIDVFNADKAKQQKLAGRK